MSTVWSFVTLEVTSGTGLTFNNLRFRGVHKIVVRTVLFKNAIMTETTLPANLLSIRLDTGSGLNLNRNDMCMADGSKRSYIFTMPLIAAVDATSVYSSATYEVGEYDARRMGDNIRDILGISTTIIMNNEYYDPSIITASNPVYISLAIEHLQ
jgi:hypothetical protein